MTTSGDVADGGAFARELIEAIPCPVFYKGIDGRYLGCNAAFVEYLGLPREQIVGHTTYDVAPKELADRYAVADAALFANPGTQIYEVQVRWADGSLRDVVMHKATFGAADGTVHGLIGVISDITERKRAEELAERLKQELERRVAERTAELEVANRELEEFSYSMSHDMRAPLRAINGYSQILLSEHGDGLDDEGKRLLAALAGNAARMGRLIDDIVRFLGLRACPMNPVGLDVAALVRQEFGALGAAQPGLKVRLELGELPPAWADKALVRQVLRELLKNALKHAAPEREAIIAIEGASEGEQSAYCVRDNGVGFDMRYAGKLFQVFERIHPAGSYEGSGIGLALVKRIIDRHGGRVWAEGKVDGGASFHFTLPSPRAT
ncbi:MAG TPA: ATP-binding protein [Rhodocyclaceae bacterium]